jgi:hypothetical protein
VIRGRPRAQVWATLVPLLIAGCGGSGASSGTSSQGPPTTTIVVTTAEAETTTEADTTTEAESLAERVCAAVEPDELAKRGGAQRAHYLARWARLGRHAGFGIGPTLLRAADALKAGHRSSFVHWYGVTRSHCDLAGA